MTCEHGLTTNECYVCSSPKYGEKKMTTLKTLEMALEAYEVPLVEQLERVPKDARLVIDDADGMGTRFIPVGRMCHEAATALRTQIALEKQQPADEPVAWMHVQGDYEEPSLFQLDGPSMDRGWDEYPLYTRPQPADEPLCEVHICDSCGYAYQDSPPSQCDCLGDEQYTKGYIYTRPQPKREWVGLTDEEVDIESAKEEEQAYGFIQGVIWAETKLKEKNT